MSHDSGVNGELESVSKGQSTSGSNLSKFDDLFSSALPKEISFLSELVFLTSFSVEEAEELSKYPDVAIALKSLTEKRLVILISDLPKQYQINSLIRQDLREVLAENSVKFRDVALRSASIIKEKNPLLALDLFGLAGDTDSALSLAVSNLQHLIYQADMELLNKWAPRISKTIGGGTEGEKLIKAYAFYSIGKFDQVRAKLREIESYDLGGIHAEVIAHESQILRMRLDFIFGKFDQVLTENQNHSISPDWEKSRGIEANFSANKTALLATFFMQDLEKFLNLYQILSDTLKSDGSNLSQFSINSFKAMKAFLLGHYLEAYEYALAACNLASELGVEGSYFPYESAYILMDTAQEFGDEELSQSHVDKYLPMALKANQYPWITSFYAKAAVIQLQKGEIQSALALINKGRVVVEGPLFGPEISFLLDGHELIIRMALGDMERVAELVYRLPDNRQVQSLKVGMEIARQPAEAYRLIKKMPADTTVEIFRKELLLANIYVADRERSVEHFTKALEIAVPNGYFRAFLNISPQLKSHILEYAQQHPTKYLENLARAIRTQSRQYQNDLIASNSFLTKRELEILRRLGSGSPILDIANDLQISKNTIKTHLKNLYRKMEVESRHDAVEKGRALTLL